MGSALTGISARQFSPDLSIIVILHSLPAVSMQGIVLQRCDPRFAGDGLRGRSSARPSSQQQTDSLEGRSGPLACSVMMYLPATSGEMPVRPLLRSRLMARSRIQVRNLDPRGVISIADDADLRFCSGRRSGRTRGNRQAQHVARSEGIGWSRDGKVQLHGVGTQMHPRGRPTGILRCRAGLAV